MSAPSYPIDYTPTGDSTATAIYKHIQEILAIYAMIDDLVDEDDAQDVRITALEAFSILDQLEPTLPADLVLDGNSVGDASPADLTKLHAITVAATAINNIAGGASNVLTQIKTVDGADSGLDADLLDGHHASYFSIDGHTHNYVAKPSSSSLPVGCIAVCIVNGGTSVANGSTISGSSLKLFAYQWGEDPGASGQYIGGHTAGATQSGTWKNISGITLYKADSDYDQRPIAGLFLRTA